MLREESVGIASEVVRVMVEDNSSLDSVHPSSEESRADRGKGQIQPRCNLSKPKQHERERRTDSKRRRGIIPSQSNGP